MPLPHRRVGQITHNMCTSSLISECYENCWRLPVIAGEYIMVVKWPLHRLARSLFYNDSTRTGYVIVCNISRALSAHCLHTWYEYAKLPLLTLQFKHYVNNRRYYYAAVNYNSLSLLCVRAYVSNCKCVVASLHIWNVIWINLYGHHIVYLDLHKVFVNNVILFHNQRFITN